MSWILLFVAGLFEIGWAIGLKYTDGFTRLWPSVGTALSMLVSVVLLGLAMRDLPVGTAYAVWTGVGSVLTVAWAAISGDEQLTPLKVVLLAGIIGCVVGLKKLEGRPEAPAADASVGTSNGEVS